VAIIGIAPRIKLLKEYGRNPTLDEESEKKLLAAADELRQDGTWNERRRRLFHDVVILMRDTGMRNERELYHSF